MADKSKTITPVNSVIRALDILEYLNYSPVSVGLSDISRRFGINRTTTYNLVASLMEKAYVAKGEDGKYHVTSRLFELGTVYQNSFPLVHLVKRSVFPIQSNFKCTCKLTVLADDMRAVIIFTRCNEDELFQLPLGYSFPLHTSASGKVLLAYSPPAVRQRYFANCDLPSYTENTITDKEIFKAELDRVREQGYAMDNGEYEPSQVCYAAPVMNNSGAMAAISVSGKKQDMLDSKQELIQEIIGYCRNLSIESGYIPSPLEGVPPSRG